VTVELFGTDDRARMSEAIAVRIEVFVDEQRITLEDELDGHDEAGDPQAVHALVRDAGGNVLAAGRYYRADERTVQIGRMAVRAAARRSGIGRRLLDALMEDARRRGYVRATLNAQDHAVGFYAGAGFAALGAPFIECDIPHQGMERTL
jgi:predicted GNAT family N-acyltransferase